MLKKIAVAFTAIVLLSGCSSSKYGSSNKQDKLAMEFEQATGSKVYFALNSSEISSAAQATLMNQIEWLEDHQSLNIIIEGHCDVRGTVDYNLGLGERRAESVKTFLTKNGISEDRVDTISYGKERPEVIGTDNASHAKNRRGVTNIQ